MKYIDMNGVYFKVSNRIQAKNNRCVQYILQQAVDGITRRNVFHSTILSDLQSTFIQSKNY